MNKSNAWRARVMTAVVASAAVYVPTTAIAQTSNDELADLVRRQAAQIERLESRIQALETDGAAASGNAGMAPQSSGSAADSSRSVVDSRQQPQSGPGATGAQTATGSMASMQKQIDTLKQNSVQVDWKSGSPKFSSRDGEFTFQPLGRLQYDYSTTDGSRFADREIDGSEFRRLRIGFQGQLMEPILYKVEFDFAEENVGVRDAYIATKKDFALGQGVVYVGNKFADRSLDGATSSKYIWFLERNPVANAIIPESGYYNLGVTSAFYGKNNWHLSAGVSKGQLGDDNNESDNTTLISRAHFNPIATDNAMMHVGAWGFYEDFARDNIDSLTDSERFASHFNDNVRVYSDTIDEPETSTGYGVELAGLAGPVAAGAEYGRRTIDTRAGDDTDYDAYSAQIGYSLTGEQFGYSTKNGTWSAPDIANPVTDGGWGAWQVMARYDALDYDNNATFAGGTGHGTTLGVSWYLNNYTRFMLNWINWNTNNRVPIAGDPTDREFTGSDDGNTISARAQVIF